MYVLEVVKWSNHKFLIFKEDSKKIQVKSIIIFSSVITHTENSPISRFHYLYRMSVKFWTGPKFSHRKFNSDNLFITKTALYPPHSYARNFREKKAEESLQKYFFWPIFSSTSRLDYCNSF